ncbi:MAG: hypothetical protein ACOX4G_05805 [Limnochordia bacterium]|jgi:hypothetical protein
MFITLLVVSFVLATGVSYGVARYFVKPIDRVLARIIADESSSAWAQYLRFAMVVVGISSGVRITQLDRYITPPSWDQSARVVELTSERWFVEIYRTVIETLRGISSMLLVFFIFALVAHVVLRFAEMRRPKDA